MLRDLSSMVIIGHKLSWTVKQQETFVGMPTHSHCYPDVLVSIRVRRNLKKQSSEPDAVVTVYRTRHPCNAKISTRNVLEYAQQHYTKELKTMIIIRLILGIVMLTAGGRLFWLFLGIVGFIFGFDLAEQVLQSQPRDILIVVALLAGLVGALLAVFIQRIAIVAGGFLAGGYLALRLMEEFGIRNNLYHWLLLALGCVIGAVLMRLLFRWAMIILSSGVGSVLILQAFPVSQHMTRLLFVILLILGIAVQAGLLGRKPPLRKRHPG